jgi:biotin-(acetyl-CoA carboxylase) ligase
MKLKSKIMALQIIFESEGKNRDTTHVIIKDGCNSGLDENSELPILQKASMLLEVDKTRREFLLKMCASVVEHTFDMNGGKIDLHCPACKRDYHIFREEYDAAKQAYQLSCN